MAKKKVLIAIIVIIALFIFINLGWFVWSHISYTGYTEDLNRNAFYTFMVPNYAGKDGDGFEYSVKFPDWLTFTGNLAVGYPGTDENPFTDGLIIWPKVFRGYEYGVIINTEDEGGYMFYIDRDGNAVDAEYKKIAEDYGGVISELLSRAENFWGELK